MHAHLCICSETPKLDLPTRLVVVMHDHEMRKPTASAILALNSLSNSELRIYGKQDQPLNLNQLDDPHTRLLVLFPDPSAATLSPALLAEDKRPISLLVPDGTWRQVLNMRRHVLCLPFAQTVQLPTGPCGEWTIRKTTCAHRLSTFEAIARAFGIIEFPQIQNQLEDIFRLMVSRIRFTKGLK